MIPLLCTNSKQIAGWETEDDISVLKTRTVTTCPANIQDTYLFSTNKQVSNLNDTVFNTLPHTKYYIKAIDVVIGDVSKSVAQRIISAIPLNPTKTMGLFNQLHITE